MRLQIDPSRGAELTEEACKIIRGDWLLAKVGALYHDIGKLRRPGFFAENIHDLKRMIYKNDLLERDKMLMPLADQTSGNAGLNQGTENQ